MLSALIAGLELLRNEAVERQWQVTTAYQFGARNLVVHVSASDVAVLPTGGLLPVSGLGVGADAHLYVIDQSEVDGLTFPTNARLAPYGALIESVRTAWLILRSPDTGKMLALDRASRVSLFFPGTTTPPRERAEFCRPLLHWLSVLDGNVVVHSGAVAYEGFGLLVAGAGNAGKSTFVRACLSAGFDILGDNVVEIGSAPTGRSLLHGVYPTVKVRPGSVHAISPDWPAAQWDDEAQKGIYFLGDLSLPGISFATSLHAATLVLDETGVASPVPASRAAGFFKVAPNTVAQFPFFEDEVLKRTGASLGRAPIFESGRIEIDRIAETAATLIEVAMQEAHDGS